MGAFSVQVGSDTTSEVYTVSRQSCTCKAWQFNHARDGAYRCKHQIRRFPPIKLCPVCRLNPISDLPTCSAACTRAARKLDLARKTEPYNSFEPIQSGARCHCIRCLKEYAHSEDHPLVCISCEQVAAHGERRAS